MSVKYNKEHHLSTNNYLWLFISLIVMLFFPVFSVFFVNYSQLIFSTAFSFVIFFGVYTVTQSGKELLIGLILGTLTMIAYWVIQIMGELSPGFHVFQIISSLCYFGFIGFEISKQLLDSKDAVSLNLVFGAITGYLIIGIVGGQLCIFLDLMEPGSFFDAFAHSKAYQYYYFSFVTLSTLGYGDITPNNEPAKALSLLIALVGQMYMTITIAIIIGKYLKYK